MMHIHGHALAKKPSPMGHEIDNFGRPFLGRQYIFNLSDHAPE